MMDLMDWKNVEKNCEDSVRSAEVTKEIESIMLEIAKKKIKKLGGKTSEEEKKEIEAAAAHEAAAGRSDEVQSE